MRSLHMQPVSGDPPQDMDTLTSSLQDMIHAMHGFKQDLGIVTRSLSSLFTLNCAIFKYLHFICFRTLVQTTWRSFESRPDTNHSKRSSFELRQPCDYTTILITLSWRHHRMFQPISKRHLHLSRTRRRWAGRRTWVGARSLLGVIGRVGCC